MATKTTNYNLTKPSYNESADISVINQNMDIIDEKMKEIENASGGGGGGASAWSDISDKPFESIGNGLEVDENGVMSAIGGTVDAYTKAQTDNLLSNKVDKEIISDEWNSATTYVVGQYCIYNNSLWKCILQHNGQAPEEGTYWTKVSVGSEFNILNSNFTVYYLHSEYVSNKTVVATKTGFYLVCCNAFSQNSSGAYLNIRVDGGQYMSAYNSNQVAVLSLSTVLFLREGQTVTKEVINCEDRTDAYNLFQVTYIGKN